MLKDDKLATAELSPNFLSFETVAKVSAAAASILDLDELLPTVSDLVKANFDLYHAHIYLLDEAGAELVLTAGAGKIGQAMKARGHSIALSNPRSLVARASRSREGVVVNDVTEVEDFLPNPLLPDTRSEMAVPMVVGDMLVGVLDVQSDTVGRFTYTDIRVMTTLAAQIGIAVQNARAFGRTEQSRRLLDSIISASPDWIYVKDKNYRYVLVNQAYASGTLGKTPQEIVGKDDYELGFPLHLIEGDPARGIRGYRNDDRQVLETGQALANPFNPVAYRDGTQHILDTEKMPLRDAEGKVIGVLGLSRDITDQHQAQEEVKKRAAELETVAQVSAAASTILDTDKLLTTVSDLTKASFDLYHAHVYMLDETGQSLTVAAGAGEAGQAMKVRGRSIALNNPRSLVARAARSREGVIVNDVTLAADFLPNPLLPDTRSELAVPMVVGDMLVGVLDVQSDKVDRFTDSDVRIMTTLAAQVAVAVQNARAFERTEEASHLLGSVVNGSPDWIFLKDRDFRYVMVNESFATWYGNRTPAAMVGKDDYDLGTPAFLIEGDPAQGIRGFRADDVDVLETGQPILNPHDVVNFPDGSLHTFDTKKLPLRDAEGKVIGVLGLSRDVTEQQQAQEEVKKRAAELETVAQVSAAASTILDTDKLLTTVSDLTKASFQLYHAHIYLLDETGAKLVLTAGAGEVGQAMKGRGHGIALSNPRSLVARAARSRQGVVVNDVTDVEDFLPNPLLPDTRAEMAVPMVVGDMLVGVLDVQSEKVDRFTDTDVRVMTTLAAQVAVAVQNARAFERTEEASHLLGSVVNGSPDWIFLKDRDFRYVMVNESFATWYGNRTPAAMVGKDDYDLGTPAFLIEGDPAQGIRGFRADDVDVLETGQPILNPHDVVNFPDGSLHTFDTKKLPLRDAEGKVIGVLGLSRDVTEQQQTQEEVKKRAAELETVAQVSAAASTILDTDKLLTTVSDLTKASFELYHAHIYLLDETGAKLVLTAGAGEAGRVMKGRGHGIALSNPRSLVARAARSHEGVVVNDVMLAPDFLPNPLLPDTRSEMAVPLIVADTLVGVLDVQSEKVDRFTDTDVRVMTTLAAQVAVAVQNARSYQQQVHMVDQLQTVDRLKSEFLASMSHELRTPLNSIIGYSQIVLDGGDGDLEEEMAEDIEAIHNSGKHLLSLINDILDLAKIEANRLEIDPEEASLSTITDEVVTMTRILLKDKPVELVQEIDPQLPSIWADPIRLKQILNNLISNAIKFTENGAIRVVGKQENDMAVIGVSDTGMGIGPDQLERVFERFHQADTSSTRKAGGTGLGLTISRHLVEMHGGKMWAESTLGQGTTFWFSLPLAAVKQ